MAHHRPETLTGAPLGRESAYPEHYDAGLLYPIERAANRAPLGIEEGALPFDGEDEWHAFELSWLNARGKPIVAVARFRLPASSPRLIESKSWKLYLNSFNQSRFASTDEVTQILERDLAVAAGAAVGERGAVVHGADAVLAASIFHFGEATVADAKRAIAAAGAPVRMIEPA